MSEGKYDAANSAVISRWSRENDKRIANGEAAQENLGKFLKEAMRNPNTMKNLAKQGVEVAKERHTLDKFMKKGSGREGYNIYDEPDVTGFEPRPWEQD